MEPNLPSQLQPSPAKVGGLFGYRKLWFFLALIILVIVGGGGALVVSNQLNKKALPKAQTQKFVKVKTLAKTADFKENLENKITTNFYGDERKDLQNYLLAASTGTMESRYGNLKAAFERMASVYKKTKDLNVKASMIQLKNYSRAFDQYQEEDMIIP